MKYPLDSRESRRLVARGFRRTECPLMAWWSKFATSVEESMITGLTAPGGKDRRRQSDGRHRQWARPAVSSCAPSELVRHVARQIVNMDCRSPAKPRRPFKASPTRSRASSCRWCCCFGAHLHFWMWFGPEPKLAHAIVNAVAVLIIRLSVRPRPGYTMSSWSASDAVRRKVCS